METVTTTAIAEYNPIAAALANVEKYRGLVCDVTTPKGMAEAKSAQREVGALRIALEKTRKKVKEDVVARGKLIDGEANRIFALIAAIEIPIMTQIDAEEDRVERARQAAILAEQERLAAEEHARKEAEARELADARAKNESEARRIAEERAKLEAEQRAARDKAEAEDRERRRKIAEEEEAARQRIAEAQDKARSERQAEEDKLRAERERVDAERRKVEDAQRQAREEEEAKAAAARRAQEEAERKVREEKSAAEREERRKAGELADADAMLDTFARAYGHLPKYKDVVVAIKALKPSKQRKAA